MGLPLSSLAMIIRVRQYDADDYARDMADFIADPVKGNGIVVFTIGLGTVNWPEKFG